MLLRTHATSTRPVSAAREDPVEQARTAGVVVAVTTVVASVTVRRTRTQHLDRLRPETRLAGEGGNDDLQLTVVEENTPAAPALVDRHPAVVDLLHGVPTSRTEPLLFHSVHRAPPLSRQLST